MAIDMSLTLNALAAKDSGKDVRRTAETQAAPKPQDVGPAVEKQPVDKATQSERPASASVAKQELEGAVSQMKDFAQMLNRELQFEVDEDLGQTVVRIVDKESGELIRQIPSEEVLALASQMKEMQEVEQSRLDGKGFREQSIGLLMKTQA